MTPETFKNEVLPLKNKLYRYAYSMLADRDLSMDVVQETMLKVWEKRDSFHSVKNPEAWCMTLARNFALNKFRSKHHKTEELRAKHDHQPGDSSPHQSLESDDMMELIDGIVSRLPSKHREVFHLRDVEGYSYQEISEMLQYSISDVKVSIFRARKEVRDKLIKLRNYELDKSRSAT
jgi:RNA polymerase sigma-70 factor (ECF subfamily)